MPDGSTASCGPGALTVRLGFDTFVIEAGSSVSFDSATPHAYINEGTEPARGVVARRPQRQPPAGRTAGGGVSRLDFRRADDRPERSG